MKKNIQLAHLLLLTCLILFCTLSTKAQSGSNDVSFNPSQFNFGNGQGADNRVWATAIQGDGKIILGGEFTTYNGTASNRIIRLHANGELDTTFNSGTGANNAIYTISLQSDGKIIIGGEFTDYNGTALGNIARLNTDGTLDVTFNTGTGANGAILTTNIQSDGKIIIGGNLLTDYNGTAINGIVRLNTNGTIDGTFNTVTGVGNNVYATVIQSNGKIVIGGEFTDYDGTGLNNIIRLNADGTVDATFNTGGTGANIRVWTLAIQTDGKIIVGGEFTDYNGTGLNYIARLNTNGTVDGTFNTGTGTNGIVWAISIQSDNKIIIGGAFSDYNSVALNFIGRLNTDGTVDVTFNTGVGTDDQVYTSAIQSDGKIIIAGEFTSYNIFTSNHIACINTDGTVNTAYNQDITGANDAIATTALQPDGKIIIGGSFINYNTTAINRVARLNIDGTLDSTFITGTGADGLVKNAAIQPDGKIIISGGFTDYNGTARNKIARLNTDGTIDATFNPGGGADNIILSTIIQSDGKIIIGGWFTDYDGTPINRIARLNADGTLDGTFTLGTGASASVTSIALQSDGKIIIGGSFVSYNGTARNKIARLNTDGTIDATFNPGTGANGNVNTIAIQNDGEIIIAGDFTTYNGSTRNRIARLNVNGTIDVTLNPGAGANNNVLSTIIQGDGKIIIGGSFTDYDGVARNRMARLNVDGTADGTFDPGTGVNSGVNTITIQSDGKLIIGGNFTDYAGTIRNRAARILN